MAARFENLLKSEQKKPGFKSKPGFVDRETCSYYSEQVIVNKFPGTVRGIVFSIFRSD
jgi:hypothetical protein